MIAPPNDFGCREWQGKKDKDGYGLDGLKRAHIAAWEQKHGPVPEGRVLDHHCQNRACCAIAHLEPVTQRENSFRKAWRYRVRIEQCPQKHDLRIYSVVTPQGGRVCRLCSKEQA